MGTERADASDLDRLATQTDNTGPDDFPDPPQDPDLVVRSDDEADD